jgi:cyclopropane fatty-acyl-phospholipid synthase-like methyltransferase
MATISRPERLEDEWRRVHERLVRGIADLCPIPPESILEVGSGRGQITIPLAERFPGAMITAVDRYQGPYSKDVDQFAARLARAGAVRRVRVIRADALKWISDRKMPWFDMVLSSEFLPELDAEQMAGFFECCFRVLCPGGLTAHLFLSPKARNARQRLVIDADSDPRWTRHRPRKWFSPPPLQAVQNLTAAGFVATRARRQPGGLAARAGAARRLLKQWGVRSVFGKVHESRIQKEGLELPDWIIVHGTRPK